MIQRGQIYWTQLDPTIGSEIKKTRPALVISNNASNKSVDTITVLPLTSKVKVVYPFEALLPAGVGGLNIPSKAKANQIRTVDKRRLGPHPLGQIVDATTMQRVDKAIVIHLDIKAEGH